MRKITLISLGFTSALVAADSLAEAVTDSKLSLDARAFYFDKYTKGGADSKAFTIGGILKAETSEYLGAKLGVAYYGNFRAGTTKDEGKATTLLEFGTGDDLSILGELYLDQKISNTNIVIGRQRINTPMMNDHDLRTLPSAYEGVVVKSKEIEANHIELGFVRKYTGFGSRVNNFDKFENS